MTPQGHITINIDDDCTEKIDLFFMEDFEERSAMVEKHIDKALHILRKLNVLLTAQASVSTISPQVQNVETLISVVRNQLFVSAQRNKSAAASGNVAPVSLSVCVERCGKLARKFSGLLAEFEKSRDRFRDALDEGIRVDLEKLNPSLNEADIDDAIRKEWKLEAVLEKAGPELLHQVESLRERHEQLSKLNREVAQLYEVFVELSFLTERQQSLINSVERNIERVESRVAKADNEVVDARQCQKCARRRVALIAAITAVTLGVATIILIVQVSK